MRGYLQKLLKFQVRNQVNWQQSGSTDAELLQASHQEHSQQIFLEHHLSSSRKLAKAGYIQAWNVCNINDNSNDNNNEKDSYDQVNAKVIRNRLKAQCHVMLATTLTNPHFTRSGLITSFSAFFIALFSLIVIQLSTLI